MLTLDEIYVKQEIICKNEQLFGQAENSEEVVAKTIQAYMIHSVWQY